MPGEVFRRRARPGDARKTVAHAGYPLRRTFASHAGAQGHDAQGFVGVSRGAPNIRPLADCAGCAILRLARGQGMTRWFLSYHTPDRALAERLKAAIEGNDAGSSVFFAPSDLRAGGAWTAQLAEELAKADAFVLLVGEHGMGKWQVPEYDEALDRWVTSGGTFPLVVVLLDGTCRDCRSCGSCTGSSRPIRRPRRTSRGSSTERRAAGAAAARGWRYAIALPRPRSDGGERQPLFLRRTGKPVATSSKRSTGGLRAHRQSGVGNLSAARPDCKITSAMHLAAASPTTYTACSSASRTEANQGPHAKTRGS